MLKREEPVVSQLGGDLARRDDAEYAARFPGCGVLHATILPPAWHNNIVP